MGWFAPTFHQQEKLRAPWKSTPFAKMEPFTVGYFKGRTRAMTLLCILAIIHDLPERVNLAEAGLPFPFDHAT